jgi:hypothetical protein
MKVAWILSLQTLRGTLDAEAVLASWQEARVDVGFKENSLCGSLVVWMMRRLSVLAMELGLLVSSLLQI